MQIHIRKDLCTSCGTCVNNCPCDVFRLNEETNIAEARYEEDCWYCGACEIDCPTRAIEVNLPYLIC